MSAKMISFVFVIIFQLYTLLWSSEADPSMHRLRYVQAIWRHGDRAPQAKPYPGDIYDESYWPRGWNQLTNLGMKQMRELGEFFQKRYIPDFLPSIFKKKLVRIRSSEENRAIESAQTFLSGFYPPQTPDQQFEESLKWQPIPVHTSGVGRPDPLLRPSQFPCPPYDRLKKQISKELDAQLLPQYKDLAEFLRSPLQLQNGTEITIKHITRLNDINREILHNLTQPDWVFQQWPNHENKTTLELITELHGAKRIAEFNDTRLAKLRGGYLLGDWLKRAHKVAHGNVTNPERMLLYSSHDGTVLALLHALQLANDQIVPYAGCLIMELYEKEEGEFFVELYYRRGPGQELEQLQLMGCSFSCHIDKFASLLEEMVYFKEENLYQDCGTAMCVITPKTNSAITSKSRLFEKLSFLFCLLWLISSIFILV